MPIRHSPVLDGPSLGEADKARRRGPKWAFVSSGADRAVRLYDATELAPSELSVSAWFPLKKQVLFFDLAVSAGVAVVVGFVFWRRPPPAPTANQSVDLYLRVQGEPESQALTFHLDVVPPSSGAR